MIPGLCSMVYRGSAGTSGGMTAVASPTSLSGGSGQVSVGPFTAMAIGGTAPFTYLWALYYGDPGATANTPATAATFITVPALLPGAQTNATFVCTITDNIGRIATTNSVNADFHLES